ncbi:MAG TPA: dipeptidase [Rhodothermales bacterium]|nr:dipeptidase [Rhodothermales bacterium]
MANDDFSADAGENDWALEHARELLTRVPLIDGHNDLPWTLRGYGDGRRAIEELPIATLLDTDTDIPRLRAGHVAAQFWSVWVPIEVTEGFVNVQLEQIDIAHRMIEAHPESLRLALTAADIEEAFNDRKIASLVGLEGGHVLANSLGVLRSFYRLGARYLTLTHNLTLDWVDSAMDEALNDGLSDFGKEVIREMNRLGMMVDLSHVSEKTMHDVLDVTEAPIIFSHSSAKALTDHPRNVADAVMRRVAENDGIVMITFIPGFVSTAVKEWEEPLREALRSAPSAQEYMSKRTAYALEHPEPTATLSDVADHIEHARAVAGIDHIGIGSDFWGSGNMPVGLEDVSRFPYLFAELIRRRWSDEELELLAGRNFLRVMRSVEAVGERLRRERRPSTALIERLSG